jgi:hypothetical protein
VRIREIEENSAFDGPGEFPRSAEREQLDPQFLKLASYPRPQEDFVMLTLHEEEPPLSAEEIARSQAQFIQGLEVNAPERCDRRLAFLRLALHLEEASVGKTNQLG